MEQNDISTENTGLENNGAENTGIASAEAENTAAQKGAGKQEDDYQSIIAAQNAKVEQMFSICFLTPENASVERTEGGLLRARINGKDYPRIHPARCFPFTSPDEYISLREGTGNQSKEIGMLRYINSLGEETAKIIKEQLDMIYFMPGGIRLFLLGYRYRQGRDTLYRDHGRQQHNKAERCAPDNYRP